MNRLVLLLLVGFLAISTGGLLELAVAEPCSTTESESSPADGACPPTCLRCHCTASFELVLHMDAEDTPAPSPKWLPPSVVALALVPFDILHVPKPTLG
jgi:hypothetical protein